MARTAMSSSILKDLDDKEIEYSTYNYLILLELIRTDGYVYILDQHITEFSITNLYDEFYFPLIKCTLYVSSSVYKMIHEQYEAGAKFCLTIDKFEPDPINVDRVYAFASNYWDHLIIEPVDFPIANQSTDPNTLSTDSQGSIFDQNPYITMNFEFYITKHMQLLDTPVTGIMYKIYMQNALLYCINNYVTNQQMLVNPSNNDKEQEQVILTADNICQTIENLQTNYGLYESGLRLYFDYDRGYCLASDLRLNNVVAENPAIEFETVFIKLYDRDSVTVTDGMLGCYSDPRYGRYMVRGINNNLTISQDNSNTRLYGEEITIIKGNVYGDEEETKEKTEYDVSNRNSGSNRNKSGKKSQYYYDTNVNGYSLGEYLASLTRTNLKIILTFINIDIEYFKINKKYYITFDNEEYAENQGTFQLMAMATNFIQKGNVFTTETECTFCRLTNGLLSYA